MINYIYTLLSVFLINTFYNHLQKHEHCSDERIQCKTNIVYLTRLKQTGIFLYILTFLYSYYEYFNDFINGFCLIISLFQIVENGEYRSFIPLMIFSTLYSLYNLSITSSLIKQQNIINHGLEHIKLDDEINLDSSVSSVIPCDIEVMDGTNIITNELELTGENLFISKKNGDVLYRGTTLVDGIVRGKAIRVGNDCCIYNINIRTNKLKTRLYQKITRITFDNLYYLLLTASVIAGFVNTRHGFLTTFKNVILLLNTLVPLSLQSFYNTATFFLSKRISEENNIVINNHGIYSFHNLPKYIITDKTGTITSNHLKVKQVLNVGSDNVNNIYNVACCSTIIRHSKTGELLKTDELEYLLIKYLSKPIPIVKRIYYKPFDYLLGVKLAVVEDNKELYLHVQGIPEIVSSYCKTNMYSSSLLLEADNNSYNRIICHTSRRISMKEYEMILNNEIKSVLKDFEQLNIYVFSDYLTEGLKDAFHKLIIDKKQISILTGDSLESVEKICKILELDEVVYENGRELTNVDNLVNKNKVVVYRATPATKERYVELLQKHGQVMMIGDGSNDIPAIIKSDIGVSVIGENSQVSNLSDVAIDKWNKVPLIVNSFAVYREKIKHIIKWVLSKHIISATILGTYYYLSNFYKTFNPINPYYMLLFNGFLYLYMSIMCIYDNILVSGRKSYREWIYQGILYGLLIGILTYNNVEDVFGVAYIIGLKLLVMIRNF